jgi:hypothetical protein
MFRHVNPDLTAGFLNLEEKLGSPSKRGLSPELPRFAQGAKWSLLVLLL